ncbi:hypothetical protein PV682_28850 [Streptomyces niveiscabiei]|uniref:hypothetical protein n=1 Tax=Streptomyces niveiscabiei TaxID=164115 RepID=UPI0029B6F019|nr:hypothetical protein [Streptomyces niveiscabiei]MDX3385442.1 hypothetical protein [Streptomyces niveiscabiei]
MVLALLVPGEACAVPCVAMAVESVEYDVVDSGLRPAAAPVDRVEKVLRPASVSGMGVEAFGKAPREIFPALVPLGLSSVRRVVLRC